MNSFKSDMISNSLMEHPPALEKQRNKKSWLAEGHTKGVFRMVNIKKVPIKTYNKTTGTV